MNPESFAREYQDQLVKIDRAWACIPRLLPPANNWLTGKVLTASSKAERAVGELNSAGQHIHNPYLLIRPFMRAEAVVSSRIEGTIASLPDVLLFEATPQTEPQKPHVREIVNYVDALESGLAAVPEQPIDLPLIRALHKTLMSGVRRGEKNPGDIRKKQNWIGATEVTPIEQARYVPPPPERLNELLENYVSFFNTPTDDIPVLIRLAMQHCQFEAIHPFADGNGRIGRVLIVLQLCREKVLSRPLLYLSPYFESNRAQYNDFMLEVSTKGAWAEWIRFFLEGVEQRANISGEVIDQLRDLRAVYWEKIQSARNSALLLRAIDLVFSEVLITTARVASVLKISSARALAVVEKLQQESIISLRSTDKQRNRVFQGVEILNLLDKIGASQPRISGVS